MKMSNLSLATLLVASSLSASESLVEAFKSGKVHGELRTQYVTTNDNDISRSENTGFAVGGQLGYVTGDYYGLKLGVTMQTNQTLNIQEDDETKRDNRVSYENTNLSEAYLQYSFNDKTSIKVGRQYVKSPLIFSSTYSHLSIDFFNAALLTTTAIPQTKIVLGGVSTYYQRDAGLDDNQQVDFDEPIYTLYVKNKSIKGLTYEGQLLYSNGEGNMFIPVPVADQSFFYHYNKLNYKLPTELPLFVEGSYYDLNYDKKSIEDTNMYAIGAGVDVGYAKIRYDYTKTDDGGNILGTLGEIPTLSPGLMTFSASGSMAGLETNNVTVNLNLAKFGIKGFRRARIKYGLYETSINRTENDELMFDFMYNFSGALKGLMIRPRFATASYDYYRGNKVDTRKSEFRFLAVYKF